MLSNSNALRENTAFFSGSKMGYGFSRLFLKTGGDGKMEYFDLK